MRTSVAQGKSIGGTRPDVVPFVNGLPLAVLEIENAVSEDATIWTAFQQLQTYKAEIPSLFATNAVLVVSDGVEARIWCGSTSSSPESHRNIETPSSTLLRGMEKKWTGHTHVLHLCPLTPVPR